MLAEQSMEPLTCRKAEFSIDPGVTYLNAAYMGPLSIATQNAGIAALRQRAFPTGIVPNDFFAPAERVRALCGQLMSCSPESIAFIPNAANAISLVAGSLELKPGQNIVLLHEQFPSNVYPWWAWKKHGVELRTVGAVDAMRGSEVAGSKRRTAVWNQAVLDAIDTNTAVVAIESAHWTDGTLFDLEAIGRAAKAVGAVFLIDATQTAGALPLDFHAINADAVVVHAYKSMLCNYGLGFMALSERFANTKPLEQSWLMRRGSENFARLVDYQEKYAAGMRRFDTSLRANPILIHMLEASLEQLLDWQAPRIQRYLYGIVNPYVEVLRSLGVDIADEQDRAGNIFGLGLPDHVDPQMLKQRLVEQQIHVSVRGKVLRIAPHVYNDEADIGRLAEQLNICLA